MSKIVVTLEERIYRMVLHAYKDDKHPMRVAAHATNTDEWIVAMLHDMIEDKHCTAQDLLNMGIESNLVNDVVMVSRLPSETYRQYIERIVTSGSLTAKAVKYFDLVDHLDPHIVGNIKASKAQRYIDAIETITKSLVKEAA